MKNDLVIDHIVNWLRSYVEKANMDGFIVGISGGIDSALTSTLCALTGKHTLVVSMPIHQKTDQLMRAHEHMQWLVTKFPNVLQTEVNLTSSFDTLKKSFPEETMGHLLSMANTRARLRMLTLYALGQSHNLLVAGTGNKIEDFGVGFFTKYGDGGVDLSPIADLVKTQVVMLATHLGVTKNILDAPPTDGLWETDRTDEMQLGATYTELEWAMDYIEKNNLKNKADINPSGLTPRQIEVIGIYFKFNSANKHKMMPIPVCLIPKDLFQ